ncbi:MAG: AAA family ATPase [Bacilli bacterium]|nr:AAA family ATPase [Bacilli bacterium]
MEKLLLPIGIEDFRFVREKCFYVDKTMFLGEIINAPESSVCFYARPRRFGKSLMLSMVSYFYDLDDSSYSLFENTEVSHRGDWMKQMNSRPVVRLNLKGLMAESLESFYSLMRLKMSDIYQECLLGKDLSSLHEEEQSFLHTIIEKKESEEELQVSLERLLRYLDKIRGITPVLLIDEYDAPLQSAVENGYLNHAQNFMKNYLGNALKGNKHLHKAVLTGVSQIAHASIFSGLNNLAVNNILGTKNEFFGFKESEVNNLLDYYGYKEDRKELREWYGGYHFQNETVYNPWSVLNFVANSFSYRPYWINTGSYSVLKSYLLQSDGDTFASLTNLLRGERSLVSLKESLSFDEMGSEPSLFSLLVYSGYLTSLPTPLIGKYEVYVPNREVKESFVSEVVGEFAKGKQLEKIVGMKRSLLNHDDEGFEKALTDYLLSSFSYFDLNSEKAYQIILITLSSLLFEDAIVKSEVNEGAGRCDILIRAKNNDYCYILELKHRKNRPTDESLLQSAKAALKQISANDYWEEARKLSVKRISLYGMAFAGKRVKIASKTIEES